MCLCDTEQAPNVSYQSAHVKLDKCEALNPDGTANVDDATQRPAPRPPP